MFAYGNTHFLRGAMYRYGLVLHTLTYDHIQGFLTGNERRVNKAKGSTWVWGDEANLRKAGIIESPMITWYNTEPVNP